MTPYEIARREIGQKEVRGGENPHIPKPHNGYTVGPVIFIHPDYRDDKGLIAHEKVHVKQFWRTGGLHSIRYKTSAKYRYRVELEAYRKQLKYSPGREELFAGYIVDRYNLSVTREQALEDLRK